MVQNIRLLKMLIFSLFKHKFFQQTPAAAPQQVQQPQQPQQAAKASSDKLTSQTLSQAPPQEQKQMLGSFTNI